MSGSRPTLILWGANLAALAFAAWWIGSVLSEPDFGPAQEAAPHAPAPRAAMPPESLGALGDGPLFTPSREAYRRLAPEPVEAAPPPLPRLVGIVLEGAEARRALLEAPEGDRRALVGAGQAFAGWTVVRILRASISLRPEGALAPATAGSELSLHLFPPDTAPVREDE